jgi:chromosome segregation ATPase
MSRSPFDLNNVAPRTLRERLAHKVKRTVEPLAIHLLDWCRSLNGRIDAAEVRIEQGEQALRAIEEQIREARGLLDFLDGQIRSTLNQVCALDGQFRDHSHQYPHLEEAASEARSRLDELHSHFFELSQRADQAEWGRDALVHRLNDEDAKRALLAQQVETLNHQVIEMHWAREALVERLVQVDAGANTLREKVEKMESEMKAQLVAVEEQVTTPQAFGLDALAMGRRIASLEDQVEALVSLLARENAAMSATLVPFPGSTPAEKAAG